MIADRAVTRRALLAGSAAVAGGPLLAACSSKNDSAATHKTGPARLPTYVAYHGARPDLPGNSAGLYDGFLRYPANPVQATGSPPGKGGELTVLCTVNLGTLKPLNKNPRWQLTNKQLGTKINLIGALGGDFNTKVQVTLASGDLPDMMMITSISHLPAVLKAKFADLTKYLSGDAIKKYPLLAALPQDTWKKTVYDGRIYGVPDPIANTGTMLYVRKDILQKRGAPTDFGSADEFLSACRMAIDRKAGHYAMGADPATWIVPIVQKMLGAPNQWKQESGKLISVIEVDETKKAIDFVAKMWKDGLIHPDSIAVPTQNGPWFRAGTTAIMVDNLANWKNRYGGLVADGLRADVIDATLAPKFYGGGKAAQWLSTNSSSFVALKKATPSRIDELLGVMNWMAAPFGTKEFELKNYGAPGVEYNLKGTDPVPLPGVSLPTDPLISLLYITRPAPAWYEPGHADVVTKQYDRQKQLIPTAVPLITEGLYSETAANQGPAASMIHDAQNAIITGRKPLSSWDDAVKQWKETSGDQIRKEYEQALSKGH